MADLSVANGPRGRRSVGDDADLGRPAGREVPGGLRNSLAELRLTYEEVGATAGPVLPKGYRYDRISTELAGAPIPGRGPKKVPRTWQAHRRAGATIYPAAAHIAAGAEVVATVRLGPLSSSLPVGSSMSRLSQPGSGLLTGPCRATQNAAKRHST